MHENSFPKVARWLRSILPCLFACCVAAMAAERPNVIVIMADDLGAEGLACYGSSLYTTPNLDRMAAEGALFQNAYSTPLCTPTRVMIMTGQYPQRTGFRGLISKDPEARLPAAYKTFGQYFKEAGYKTAIAGKWQLGQFDHFPEQPMEHGFDEHCLWKWYYEGKRTDRFYSPGIYQNGESKDGGPDVYGPDRYNDFVLDFIERHRSEPFFVYYPMALVHAPFLAPPDLKDLAYSKYPAGLDKNVAIYGHMITYADMLVGKLLDKLKEIGQDENTLVIFTGDNGCPKEIVSALGKLTLKGGKGSMTEAGTRVPFIARWPGKMEPGERSALISLADVLPSTASLAGFPVASEVDGMDVSRNLLSQNASSVRDHIIVCYRDGYFARDERYRLHEDGRFFDIPNTSNESRYSERENANPEALPRRARLQRLLDEYQTIPQTLSSEELGKVVR